MRGCQKLTFSESLNGALPPFAKQPHAMHAAAPPVTLTLDNVIPPLRDFHQWWLLKMRPALSVSTAT